jgi:ferredoxin
MERQTCHDCNCKEGEIHMPGCDMEVCPFCGGQLISCDCCYTLLGFAYDWGAPNCGLPEAVYKNGLPDELLVMWDEMLEEKGFIPYIRWPNLCRACGELWPEMFMLPDDEWKHYIAPDKRDQMVCRSCYDGIKTRKDAGKDEPQWPTLCAKCGKHHPEGFEIPDGEWNRYIHIRRRRKEVLCKECYDQIVEWIKEAEES